jgi:hypothetical protein
MPVINTTKISKEITVREHASGMISIFSHLLNTVVVLTEEEQKQLYEIIKRNTGLGE